MSILSKYLYNSILSDNEYLKDLDSWELISISDNHHVYYDKERGMYKVEFSSGQWCIFDEY